MYIEIAQEASEALSTEEARSAVTIPGTNHILPNYYVTRPFVKQVNMLAREYCDMTKPKIKFKPVILSHHMLAGLKEGQAKMSKSDPGRPFSRASE